MRVLKITAFATLLSIVLLSAVLAWLVRSEQGSRWLLEQVLGVVPVTIEASGISGTLAEGLGVESLLIALPPAEIRAEKVVISWSPVKLLEGIVDINSVHIAGLSVDVLETGVTGDSTPVSTNDPGDAPIDDQLFWLQLPVYIYIESGQIDKLRVEKAEFENLSLAGTIGHGRLDIEALDAHMAGIKLLASGELAGPDPGRLRATASWEMPAENISGGGSFNGDIDRLNFEHVLKVPETVNFNGTIYNLFSAPSLTGVSDWSSVRLPGETVLYSKAGNIKVSSDFQSARLEGNSMVLLEGLPQATVQLEAIADLQGITIDTYTIDVLDGVVTGSGRIEYGDGLQGKMEITGKQIDTGLIRSDLPGRLGFDARLLIESADRFVIDVNTANALIAGKNLAGKGQAKWHDGKLTAVDANINAGTNRLSADVKLGKRLAGRVSAKAPDLALLWPGLQGALNASISLGGSPEHPVAHVAAEASSVSFGTQSLDTFNLSGELKGDGRLDGNLEANGLVAGDQKLGNLVFILDGTLAEHQAKLHLSGGVVDVDLRASGGWDGEYLTQHFAYGRVKPEGFDSWQLEQNPVLRLSAVGGQVSAHCWKQHQAGICMGASNWDKDSLQSEIVIDDFDFNTLKPLLEDTYIIDGTVNMNIKLLRNTAGVQGELHWRQSRTVVGYADEVDEFRTVLDEVRIDLITNDTQTTLDATMNGEQGLNLNATASVVGPLAPESPLKAVARGTLPSIGLLRPLVQRVVNPSELKGKLTIDLEAAGTLDNPIFTGGAYLADGSLGLVSTGVTYTDINISAQSKTTDKLLVSGEFRSGEGSARIFGDVRAAEDMDLAADIHIQGQDLATVQVPDLSVDTSPDLLLHIGEGVFNISGKVVIPGAMAEIRELPRSAVPRSEDVTVHLREGAVEQEQGTILTGEVEVVLGDDVRFKGFGLSSRLEGGLRLTQKRGGYIRTSGTVRVRDGFLTGYGKELRVDRGELTFTGPLDDPLINIQVSRESYYDGRQYTIGLRLTGSAQNVKTEPFSRPAMSERDVLSFLLLDRPSSSDADASGAALALGLQQLFPDQSGVLGLDEVSFETNDANEAAMVAGKRINEKLYVRYVFGSMGVPGSFRIRYQLGQGFSLEASTGSHQAMDLIYMLER